MRKDTASRSTFVSRRHPVKYTKSQTKSEEHKSSTNCRVYWFVKCTGPRCTGLSKCHHGNGWLTTQCGHWGPGRLPLDDGQVTIGKGLIIPVMPPELSKCAPVSTTPRGVTVWGKDVCSHTVDSLFTLQCGGFGPQLGCHLWTSTSIVAMECHFSYDKFLHYDDEPSSLEWWVKETSTLSWR